ncbi:MAG: hypothetical protein RLN75_01985 [Longimicrobiales bacterium]
MSDNGFEIPGVSLKYPGNVHGTITAIAMVAGLVATAWIVAETAEEFGPDGVASVVAPFVSVELDDGSRELSDRYLIQFWTPSPETEAYEVRDWERGVSEEDVVAFGDSLVSKQAIAGYRRWSVFGRGRTTNKVGYWWVVTVTREFDLREFETLYRTHWGADRPIYVETTLRGGEYTSTLDSN